MIFLRNLQHGSLPLPLQWQHQAGLSSEWLIVSGKLPQHFYDAAILLFRINADKVFLKCVCGPAFQGPWMYPNFGREDG